MLGTHAAGLLQHITYKKHKSSDYINDGKTETLVSAIPGLAPDLREPIYYEVFGYTDGIVYVDESLKTIADRALQEHTEFMAEIAAWEAAHPGELYPYVGGGGLSSDFVDEGLFDASVIGLDSSTSNTSDTNGINPDVVVGIILVSVMLVAAISFLVVLRTRKRTH